jgi:site-specific recombinase XerD
LKQREAGPGAHVFVNQGGQPYTEQTLSEAISRIAKRAGITRIPVRAHVLRHTFNVYARVDGKLDPVMRASLLGHANTGTVMQYDHVMPDEAQPARAIMRRVFSLGPKIGASEDGAAR